MYQTREAIAASQLEQLRSLLAELFPSNQFYARKYNSLALTFDVASLQDFSARFPFTTKSELIENQRLHPPFGTNLTYPLERYTRYHQTSGTSGSPLRWLDTPESWDWMVESWMEIFRAAGARAGDRVFFAFSFGPFIGFWLAFEAAGRLGCLCLPGGGLSSAARVRAILDNQATILCCTPTYAIRLAEVAGQEKISLSGSRVRTLIVAGEPGGSVPSVRAHLAGLWPGARVFDHHGMTEVGPVTHECPAQPGTLHVMEEAYLAEVIEPATQQPVQPGQIGELVLTTLGRVGSPLLRYRTGDLVRLQKRDPSVQENTPAHGPPHPGPLPLGGGEGGGQSVVLSHGAIGPPCKCGRYEMALEGGILGRVDDMVIVRGVNVFPSAVDEIVRRCGGIAEYQVEISRTGPLPELSLQIEPRPDCSDLTTVVHNLERAFESAFALRVPITTVPAGTLPRYELKANRWIKKLE